MTRSTPWIDALYAMNEGKKNHLTGQSGNAVASFLAAYDPVRNLSVISLKDRRAIVEFIGLEAPFDWEVASIGTRIAASNQVILEGIADQGMLGSVRTVSRFFYWPEVRALWKGESTVKRVDKQVSVSVPTAVLDDEEELLPATDSVSESMQIQGLIAHIGTQRKLRSEGRPDRSRWLPRLEIPEYNPDYWATYFSDPDGIRLEVTNYWQERRDRHDRW